METVKNGKEKQEAYTQSFDTLNKAMKNGFYLEAVVITYAIMEDRLVSFLHHAGIVTRDKGNMKVNTRLYPYMRELLKKEEKKSINVKDISVKIALIKALMNMTANDAKSIDAIIDQKAAENCIRTKALAGYMENLYEQIEKTLNRQEINELLDAVDHWRDSRNQLIHALLSKTASTSEVARIECAENGYTLARNIDNILVKRFKRKNDIRKKYNIQ